MSEGEGNVKEGATESDSGHYQRALDLEALGMMGISPEEKYRREVDVVFSPDQGKFSSLPRGSKVLDVACGRGHTSKLMREAGFEVTAMDSSATAIDVAKDHFSKEQIDFRVGDMKNPPRIEGGYDAVTCFGRSFAYFQRYEEYIEALKNWHDSLKDNGRVAIEWTEWTEGVGGNNWQSVEGIQMRTEEGIQIIVDLATGETLSYGESEDGQFEYPGARCAGPIKKRKGGRIYKDAEGKVHDFGAGGTFFVDLLKQRNFPLLQRMLSEAGFRNVRLIEAPQSLIPPGQPRACKIFTVTAEKVSNVSILQSVIDRARHRWFGIKH